MFEDATGLSLTDSTGSKDELPPITTFLNRLLALTIELQGVLITAFERLLNAKIEGAIASGSYDVGLETLRAESFIRSEEHTSELQSLMRISYAVFCLKKNTNTISTTANHKNTHRIQVQ